MIIVISGSKFWVRLMLCFLRLRKGSGDERRRQKFLVEKGRVEEAVRVGREGRLVSVISPERQLEIAVAVLERQDALRGRKEG